MDNVALHVNPRIKEVIRQHGCQVRYLPPYSLNLNPIELTFSVLKTWIRRHFHKIWPQFNGTFGEFLRYSINQSHYDQYARRHFKHSSCYIYEADLRELERRLEASKIDFEETI